MLNERLLIMRLITSVGLALLLALGLAATAHTDMDGTPPVALVGTDFIDPHVVPAHAVVGSNEAVADVSSSPSDVLLGTALCAFGVLCGLTLMVALRSVWRRCRRPQICLTTRMLLPLPVSPVARLHAISLPLTRLGISRT